MAIKKQFQKKTVWLIQAKVMIRTLRK